MTHDETDGIRWRDWGDDAFAASRQEEKPRVMPVSEKRLFFLFAALVAAARTHETE